MVPSNEPLTMSPLGVITSAATVPPCSRSACTHAPLSTFHTRTTWSLEPLTSTCATGHQASAITAQYLVGCSASGEYIVRFSLPSASDHTLTALSCEPLAIRSAVPVSAQSA